MLDYIKLVPSTDQSTRTLDIPNLLRRLGLVIQIDLSSTRVSLEVKAWVKTQQCLVNLGDSTTTARLLDSYPLRRLEASLCSKHIMSPQRRSFFARRLLLQILCL